MTTVADYLARRAAAAEPAPRPTCPRCWKAVPTCYCHVLRPFAAPVEFVILQHNYEAKNSIATARMAHLSLTNSRLVIGRDFDGDARVDRLLAEPGRRNVLLYPRADAEPLDDVLAASLPPGAEPLVLWVLDAKWSHAPKMLRLSPAVRALPATAFVPVQESRFRIRKQPNAKCLSTIEAIHTVIDRHAALAGHAGREHDALLDVFQHLVLQQLDFCDWERESRHAASKRRRHERARAAAAERERARARESGAS
jgi:DTW domain-containing protein YfiP